MKNIIIVTTSLGKGGAERVATLLANHYTNLGYKVHVVMLWHNIIEQELDSRVDIVDLSNDSKSPYIDIIRVTIALRRLIKDIQPISVVSFIAQNNIVSYIASRGLGVRIFPSERIDPSIGGRSKIFSHILEYVYGHSTKTILQTKRAKSFFNKKVQSNCEIIYNPVVLNHKTRIQSQKKIVSVGRLTEQKNHRMLIDAFFKLHKEYPDYKLVIYGEGELRDSLEEQIHGYGMEGTILLPGIVQDVSEHIRDAEIFVLSSDYEGLSNALLEAMMIGLPVISTNCSGSDEIISDGENGILIPTGDTEALYNSLAILIKKPEMADKLGKNSQIFAEKSFSLNIVLDNWDRVILQNDYLESIKDNG